VTTVWGARQAHRSGGQWHSPFTLYLETLFLVQLDFPDQDLTTSIRTLDGDHKWRASPTGADGKLWILDHGGVVHVFDAATGKRVHRAELGEPDDDNTRSSIAIAHGSLFVRTNARLYRIGQ